MKIRNVLFGYCYKNGIVVVCEKEAETVKEIFTKYRDGRSLLKLSEELNERKIEYMLGVTGWNKSRVMRLLGDKRYTGEGGYPALIERELFDVIQELKWRKCDQKNLDRTADIFQMTIPVCCAKCAKQMRRVVDRRDKNPVRWSCKTVECNYSKGKPDDNLFEELTFLLNIAIENPERIEIPPPRRVKESDGLWGLNGEINRLYDSSQIDVEQLKSKILMTANLKYAEIDSAVSRAQRIKDIFSGMQPLKEFSLNLLERTVDFIKFYKDGRLGIVLENGQEIRAEVAYEHNCN